MDTLKLKLNNIKPLVTEKSFNEQREALIHNAAAEISKGNDKDFYLSGDAAFHKNLKKTMCK